MPNRPLSPHLSIYRPQISSVLSILHRLTGLALFAGTALVVAWLCSAAYAPAFYATLHDGMDSFIGRLCLLGWTLAFYCHFCNGIRHLFWDIGMGFTLPQMARSGWAVIVLTIVFTALTWGFVSALAG
ncbi:MAG: succinate dehydrogenase, cytochrome b556 subunit [Pseudomonadota bacterium]|nr:succinate dehydrogenase, cytochrome b556 subunit [Pseudomonadota bacterium]MDE3037884.1 succinate dehydrogenase, cytochrome b556 subunit [Pseudomonadota bacterium]